MGIEEEVFKIFVSGGELCLRRNHEAERHTSKDGLLWGNMEHESGRRAARCERYGCRFQKKAKMRCDSV